VKLSQWSRIEGVDGRRVIPIFDLGYRRIGGGRVRVMTRELAILRAVKITY
jgi:hypothetical protein